MSAHHMPSLTQFEGDKETSKMYLAQSLVFTTNKSTYKFLRSIWKTLWIFP